MRTNKKKRLLTPKYDVIFKALFGRKGSEEILKGLLNTILPEDIKSVSLNENPILLQEYPDEKLGILDVVAKIIDAISPHVTWNMIPDYTTKEELFGDIEIHIIEMPKVLKYNNVGRDLKNWIEFILNPESEGVKMSVRENVMLNKAYEKLETISNDEYLREIEELKLKAIRDEISIRNGEREEGREEGMQQGFIKGEIKGRKEIAKKLLVKGLEKEEISEITGLTLEEINKL